MTITIGNVVSGPPVGSQVPLQVGYAQTQLLQVEGATWLRSGNVIVGESATYPVASGLFGWPGKYWTRSAGTPLSGGRSGAYFNGAWHVITSSTLYRMGGNLDTWSTVSTGVSGTYFQLYVAAGRMYLTTSGGIYYTTDGSTFTATNLTGSTVAQMQLVNGIWMAYGTATNSYWTSTDGLVWTSRTQSNFTPSGQFAYSAGLYLIGSTAIGTYYTSADGMTWGSVSHPYDTFSRFNMYPANGGIVYVIGTQTFVNSSFLCYVISASGVWSRPMQEPVAYLSGIAAVDLSTNMIYCGVNGSTTNGMVTFSDQSPLTIRPLVLSATSENISSVSVGNHAVLVVSTTGAVYYSDASIGMLVEEFDQNVIKYMRVK